MASDLVVLSHREPYDEVETQQGRRMRRRPNGVFTALDSLMKERRGTWIAWKERTRGDSWASRVAVPSALDPRAYTVRRIPLDPDEASRFYYDFTSTAIWPVLFSLLDRARFTQGMWSTYQRVNETFAAAACEEAAPGGLVWINDFHLMLAPRLIRERRPDLSLAMFLHTTFPPPDVFAVVPWRQELLHSLLHLDLMGFHIPSYACNFAEAAGRFLGANVLETAESELIPHGPAVAVPRYPRVLRYHDHEVTLGAFPVGVDVEHFARLARDASTRARREEIRRRTGAQTVVLSAERSTLAKEALERLGCFERFLERNPDRHGKVSLVQVAVPSRTGVEGFESIRTRVENAVARINGRFGTPEWQPVLHLYGSVEREELVGLYTAADVVWITPLRDGMNVVAKEFVACNPEGDGVVILSEFAGAAAELEGVVLTNPYSPDDMDRALEEALNMPAPERIARMVAMRERVLGHDAHTWARSFLQEVERVGSARAETAP